MGTVRPTGHLQVKGGAGRRRYFALWRDADGRHQVLLGPAHVKDSGRRTPRGAIVWRAGDGPLPSPDHLTPAHAAAALRELLAAAPERATPAGHQTERKRSHSATWCAEWLRYVEHEAQRTPATSRRLPQLGACVAVTGIRRGHAARQDRHGRDRRLARRSTCRGKAVAALDPEVADGSPRVLARAKRRGWIAVNPATDAERVSVKRTGSSTCSHPCRWPRWPRRRERPGRRGLHRGGVHWPTAWRTARAALG